MVNTRRLAELDEAQEQERRRARLRIETAERYIDAYRSRIRDVQEQFYDAAVRGGVADDAGFRHELGATSHNLDENVARAGRKVAELEEEYDQLLREQSEERERLLAEEHQTD